MAEDDRNRRGGPRRGDDRQGGGRRQYGDKQPSGDRGRRGAPEGRRFDGPKRPAARPGREHEFRGDGSGESFKQVRDDFDAPEIPEDVSAGELDVGARAQLKSLAKDNAEEVARHLVMVARLIDDAPERALEHATAASRRAGRIGVVRETLGITAYRNGDFALALRELRTFRRITGSDEQLPLMVDSERGLGRPERALELARSVDASTLSTETRVELAIVRSGARLDLGQTQAALDELRIPELQKKTAYAYSPALFEAYGMVLEDLGRASEAAEWFDLADRAAVALEEANDPGDTESMVVVEERVREDDR